MDKSRLEAFSDGVIAILITIMVFDIKAPTGSDAAALKPILPVVLTYLLSFLHLGIYWNNHHHMLKATHRITGAGMWANLHLLFWLSLLPVATSWLRNTDFAPLPAAVYGGVLFLAALAYMILQTVLIRGDGPDSKLREAVGGDIKGKLSPALYALGIAVAYVNPLISIGLYLLVALIWLVPDLRIESRIAPRPSSSSPPTS
jgi:uncharacterized membrane protein